MLRVVLTALILSPWASPTPDKGPAPAKAQTSCEAMPTKDAAQSWRAADCFFKAGQTARTIELLRQISSRYPQELDAYFTASGLLWNEGRRVGGDEERKKSEEALDELMKAKANNPTDWQVFVELGDFYFIRKNQPEKAYGEYLKARAAYDGDPVHHVAPASNGRRSAIENRIARTTEKLGRGGEAVEASCRALFFDPNDKSALARLERLNGSCVRKGVKDPRKKKG